MLHCPARLPPKASSRFPGGVRKSSAAAAASSMDSLRLATDRVHGLRGRRVQFDGHPSRNRDGFHVHHVVRRGKPRTYISSNGNVRMDPDETTLPASCISPAMDYAAFKLLKRRNVKVNADRETAYNDAMTYFRDVAVGKVNPESYGSATTDTTGGPAVEIVTSSRSRMDAERLEGL